MIDFVWILGSRSKLADAEIGWSMRSVMKHVAGVRDLIVVGDIPRTDPGVEYQHFKFAEDPKANPADNARAKIIFACSAVGASENFVLMNDDFFICRDMPVSEFTQHWQRGNLLDHIHDASDAPTPYSISLLNTYNTLRDQEAPTKDYELHFPMLINRERLVGALIRFKPTSGVLTRSIYGNSFVHQPRPTTDCKFDSPIIGSEILRRTQDRFCFSCGDGGLLHGGDLRAYLERQYPVVRQSS